MERGEGVDVTNHMITHDLFIEAFTQSLYSWNVLALSNKQNTHFSLLYSNSEIKQCTASVNVSFQNLVKVCVGCLHGFLIKFADWF